MRLVRVSSLLLAVAIAACFSVAAEELLLRGAGEDIRVSAPRLNFLAGKPLERMRNGNSVAFDFHLAILGEGKQNVLRRSFDRFVISYDLWQETFSVARMRKTQKAASHLTASAAQSWCIDNLAVTASGLADDRPVWFRLDVRVQDPAEQTPISSDDTLSLSYLIEIFSRPVKQKANQWRLEAGPIRLRDLRSNSGRTGD